MKCMLKAVLPTVTTVCMLFFTSVIAQNDAATTSNCTTPSNLALVSQTNDSASFSWDSNGGVTVYKIWYVRENDGSVSPQFSTSSTSINLSNLSSGTYTVYLVQDCNGSLSDAIIYDDLIMG